MLCFLDLLLQWSCFLETLRQWSSAHNSAKWEVISPRFWQVGVRSPRFQAAPSPQVRAETMACWNWDDAPFWKWGGSPDDDDLWLAFGSFFSSWRTEYSEARVSSCKIQEVWQPSFILSHLCLVKLKLAVFLQGWLMRFIILIILPNGLSATPLVFSSRQLPYFFVV